MGFFSWMTCDTNESIANNSTKKCRTVYLLQPNSEGNIKEISYEGYGEFGNVDAYEWLAERNGKEGRSAGMDLAFGDIDAEFPLKFSFNKNACYEDYDASDNCEGQGYFYEY